MFPEVGFSEMVLIGIVALLVVGPKELPTLLKKIGEFTRNMRMMATDFRSNFEDLAHHSEIEDLRREISELRQLNPLNEIRGQITGAISAGQDYYYKPQNQAASHDEISDDEIKAHNERVLELERQRLEKEAAEKKIANEATAAEPLALMQDDEIKRRMSEAIDLQLGKAPEAINEANTNSEKTDDAHHYDIDDESEISLELLKSLETSDLPDDMTEEEKLALDDFEDDNSDKLLSSIDEANDELANIGNPDYISKDEVKQHEAEIANVAEDNNELLAELASFSDLSASDSNKVSDSQNEATNNNSSHLGFTASVNKVDLQENVTKNNEHDDLLAAISEANEILSNTGNPDYIANNKPLEKEPAVNAQDANKAQAPNAPIVKAEITEAKNNGEDKTSIAPPIVKEASEEVVKKKPVRRRTKKPTTEALNAQLQEGDKPKPVRKRRSKKTTEDNMVDLAQDDNNQNIEANNEAPEQTKLASDEKPKARVRKPRARKPKLATSSDENAGEQA